MAVLHPVNPAVKIAASSCPPYWERIMDGAQNISVALALQDADCCPDTNTQFVPPRDPALAGAIAKRPALPASRPLRMLLADRIDRQFPLIRSA